MNDTIKLVPEEDVKAARRLLERTRQWFDFLKVDEWKPGETHRCNYETLIKDFGLQLSRTKPRSFVITLRDNASYLWEYEDYPQMQASTLKLQTGEHVLYLTRVAEVVQFTEICPEVEITEIPKGKKEVLAEQRYVIRSTDGKLLQIHTDKGWKKKEELSDDRWVDAVKALQKQRGILEIAPDYSYIDPTGTLHDRKTIVDLEKIAWLNDTGKKLNLDPGDIIDLGYEARTKRLEVGKFEKLYTIDHTLFDQVELLITAIAIGKVKAGETDIEKIVVEARADAVKAEIKAADIETLVTNIRAKIAEGPGPETSPGTS